MKLEIDWQRTIPLKRVRAGVGIYTVDLDDIPREPGIYIFARRWGTSYEALYVGKSKRLHGRIRGHLNNLRLMQHIHEAKTGKRAVIFGRPIPKPGQSMDRILATLERALIKHFLLLGHDLVNSQGTRVRRHEITSVGHLPKSFMPLICTLREGEVNKTSNNALQLGQSSALFVLCGHSATLHYHTKQTTLQPAG